MDILDDCSGGSRQRPAVEHTIILIYMYIVPLTPHQLSLLNT
jgi:hypothetical protein